MRSKKGLIKLSCVFVFIVLFIAVCSMIMYNRNIAIVRISDSSQLNQKLKSAILGNGVLEFSEPEANAVLDMGLSSSSKLKSRVKAAYIKILDKKIELNAVVSIHNIDLFLSTVFEPGMHNNSISLSLDKVSIGRLPIPRKLAISIIDKYSKGKVEALDDGSIDVGSRILMFDIKNIEVEGGKIRLELLTEPDLSEGDENEQNNDPSPEASITPTSTPDPTQTPTPKPTQPKSDPKVTALKRTNSQLRGVLKDVESKAAKEWVELVISVNSRMINNPNGDFSSEISSAKGIYSRLPESDRKDIKEAALNNLDIASVRFLYEEYGL